MKPDKNGLKRLRRLERIREVAKQTAAMQSAEAEGILAQLTALRDRTHQMAEEYRPAASTTQGADLQRVQAFVDGVVRLTGQTDRDITLATSRADALRGELMAAQRRMQVVSERVADRSKALGREKAISSPSRRRHWPGT